MYFPAFFCPTGSNANQNPFFSFFHYACFTTQDTCTALLLWGGVLVAKLLLAGVDKLLGLGNGSGLLCTGALSRIQHGRVGHCKASLDRRAIPEPQQPGLDVGEHVVGRGGGQFQAVDPAHKGNVGDAVLAAAVAHQVVAVLEAVVEDAVQALRLAHVALHAVGHLFLGKAHKVAGLALHGADAAVLEADPRLGPRVVVRVDGPGEEVLGVVATRQVSQDGVALKDGQALVVVVDNGGDAAVGVDGREPGLLLHVCANVAALPCILEAVCLFELLQQDAGLDAVGGACPGQRQVMLGELFAVFSCMLCERGAPGGFPETIEFCPADRHLHCRQIDEALIKEKNVIRGQIRLVS